MKIYFDGKGAILGRLGSVVCKELLKGNEVVIFNSEKVIISGDKQRILEKIIWRRNLGGKGLKGPKLSKIPERMLKRMIRGMLTWDKKRGRDAYRILKCYAGKGCLKEDELKNARVIEMKKLLNFIELEDICNSL